MKREEGNETKDKTSEASSLTKKDNNKEPKQRSEISCNQDRKHTSRPNNNNKSRNNHQTIFNTR